MESVDIPIDVNNQIEHQEILPTNSAEDSNCNKLDQELTDKLIEPQKLVELHVEVDEIKENEGECALTNEKQESEEIGIAVTVVDQENTETQDETQPKIQTDPQLAECQSTEEIKEEPIEANQPQAVSRFEDDKQENEQNELNIDEGKKDQDDGRNQLNNQEIFEEEHKDMRFVGEENNESSVTQVCTDILDQIIGECTNNDQSHSKIIQIENESRIDDSSCTSSQVPNIEVVQANEIKEENNETIQSDNEDPSKVEDMQIQPHIEIKTDNQIASEFPSICNCEEEIKQVPTSCDQIPSNIINNLDQEIKMEDIKQESNENEEFNLSQIQIKEDYFEEAIDEDLEKKITSAKKNFFDFSESDKDFNQFGENKQNEDTENDTNKANENEEINNDDSVPEMDHPSVHNEQTSFENKGLDGLKSEQEKITKILIPGESVQNIENYIENVEKEDEAQQQHKSINKEDEDQQNPENTLESHGLNSSNNSSEKKDSYIDLKKTKSTEVIVMNEVENSNNNDKPIDSINSLEEDAEGIQTHTNEGVAEPAELAHDKSPILDEVVKKELEEASEDEIVEPVKINYMLPGEHEACVGASTYNLDTLDDALNQPQNEVDSKPIKQFMKKPSFKPKKVIVESDKLDEDLGVMNLTKDEAERRLSEYLSPSILGKLRSPKWESKVIGIQWLQEWLIVNNVPAEICEYGFRFLKGVMKEWKETNSNMTKSSSELIVTVLRSAERIGKRSISIVIPYLCEKLRDTLVKDYALESIMLCAELNVKNSSNIGHTIRQLIKYGPKSANPLVLKEVCSTILLLIQKYGNEGIILNEFFTFIVSCLNNKMSEIRNESVIIIKEIYRYYGDQILSYLDNVKPATLSVITQELQTVIIPEHLKLERKPAKNVLTDEEFLISPEKQFDKFIENKDDYFDIPANIDEQSFELEENKSEDEFSNLSKSIRPDPDQSFSSKQPTRETFNKSRKQSKAAALQSEEVQVEFLVIKDVGSKEARDKQDCKSIWVPNEIRTDIVLKIRDQIKAAFGSNVEENLFCNDFNKHIACLKKFEACLCPEYQHIDEFFCIIDLIFKWIFIKGCEGSNINTKFLIEIINFLEYLIDFFDNQSYELMEAEGIILITFLIDKVTNNNATLKDRIKSLIIKICSNEAFYPLKPSFKLIMQGVQNKNSKIK